MEIMKLLKRVMYVFYRYYSKGGTRTIPYASALFATVLLIFIHIFQILIIFDKVDTVLPGNQNEFKIIRYLKMAIFLLPIGLFVGFAAKKRDIENMEYEEGLTKKWGRYLVLY